MFAPRNCHFFLQKRLLLWGLRKTKSPYNLDTYWWSQIYHRDVLLSIEMLPLLKQMINCKCSIYVIWLRLEPAGWSNWFHHKRSTLSLQPPCRFEKKVCNLALHMFKATSVVLTRKSIKQENPVYLFHQTTVRKRLTRMPKLIIFSLLWRIFCLNVISEESKYKVGF